MILYPAIDLKDGQCVRLLQGDMNKATVFGNSPAEQAKAFWDAGCEWLHIVDLDGAFAGKPVNRKTVLDILKTCPEMKIQLGGGIRDMDTIEYWLDAGISRVILGTAAAIKPEFTRRAASTFPKKIAIGIDARDGFVATHGWAKTTNIKATYLARMYKKDGIVAIIYTDIARDGAMKGPNIYATIEMAKEVNIPVIASGGVSDATDLIVLNSCTPSLNGAIVGRALYDKKIDIKETLTLLKNPPFS